MAQLQSTAVTGSLTTTGNVGIGTASPNSYNGYTTLTLNGSTGGVVDFESGGSRIATINNPGSGLDIYTMVAAPIVFGTNVTARMTITGGGNVGISTTNPIQRLQIGNLTSTSTGTPESFSLGGTYSNSAGNNPKIRLWEDGTYYMGFGISSDQLNYMLGRTIYRHVFYADGNPLMTILGTGNVGIGTTNPSYKLHIDGNSSGLNLSGGNNRIYFSGYRALEGSTDGGNLQIGEGYSQISLQSGTIGISTTVTQAQFYIYNNNSYSAANINETTGSLMAFRIPCTIRIAFTLASMATANLADFHSRESSCKH